jgi:hypothetical protein
MVYVMYIPTRADVHRWWYGGGGYVGYIHNTPNPFPKPNEIYIYIKKHERTNNKTKNKTTKKGYKVL